MSWAFNILLRHLIPFKVTKPADRGLTLYPLLMSTDVREIKRHYFIISQFLLVIAIHVIIKMYCIKETRIHLLGASKDSYNF